MLFSSLEFLFYFLPVTLGVYYACPRRARNAVLLLASLLFYTWGAGGYVALLLLAAAAAYVAGRMAGRGTPGWRRAGIAVTLVANLGVLAFYKYAPFVVDTLNDVSGTLGIDEAAWADTLVPIGLSFYTFQAMSYVLDVARGRIEAVRRPLDLFVYLAMFPHLIAGPIVRFRNIAEQIHGRSHTLDGFAEGAVRFVHGLAKKLLVADTLGRVVDAVYAQGDAPPGTLGLLEPAGTLTFTAAWLGTIAFALQLYFDFSGYSDMAIGLGRMFGFRFPENFRRPHSATSVTEFWQRWHITLSTWFRDYVLTPLRGRSPSAIRANAAILATFLLIGLWHGASWTFVIFGLIHGVALVVERSTGLDRPGARRTVTGRLVTSAVLLASVPFFRAPSLTEALEQLRAMVAPTSFGLPPLVDATLTSRAVVALAVASVVFVLPRGAVIGRRLAEGGERWVAVGRTALLGLALPVAVSVAATPLDAPFIYFQF